MTHFPSTCLGRFVYFATLLVGLVFGGCARGSDPAKPPTAARKYDDSKLLDGDILFQDSNSAQSQAIRELTHSAYCHIGVYLRQNGRGYVYHAGDLSGPVPFAEWVGTAKGYGEARRLRAHGLSPQEVASLKAALQRYAGRRYDALFQPDSSKLYCSEYVALAYRDGLHVDLASWEKFSDFHFTDETRARLEKRYRDAGKQLDMSAAVISPERIRRSSRLVLVP